MKSLLLVLLLLAPSSLVFGQSIEKGKSSDEETQEQAQKANVMPTSGDIKAGIDANLAKFRTVHLVYSMETKKTDAWYGFRKNKLTHDKNLIMTSFSDPKVREQFSNSFQEREFQLKQKPTHLVCFEYLTDGSGFQWRTPAKMDTDGFDLANWKFATEPLNGKTLATVYKDYWITSFAPRVPGGARFWPGTVFDGPTQGCIADNISDIKSANLVVPAMVPAPSEWNRDGDNLYDFLSLQPADFKVLREETLADRKVYLVESSKVHPLIEKATGFLATCRNRETLHVWIDPSRGFLPTKMEWCTNIECDDPQYTQKSTEPTWISTTDEIQEMSNGGFYPLRITLKRFGPSPETAFEPSPLTFQEQLKSNNTGKNKPIPTVVSEITTWITESIDISPIDPGVFLLEFPENTHYYDKSHGIVGVQGKPNERLLAAAQLKKAFYDALRKNPAPELEGSVWLNSEPIRLEEVKGRPIILHFWSMGCGPCVMELADIQKKWGKTTESNSGPLFISIHPFGEGNDIQQLKELIQKKKITFPVMVDSMFQDNRHLGKTFSKYRIDFTPADAEINKNGHFEKIILDEIISEGDQWMREIEEKNIEAAVSEKLKNSEKPSDKSNPSLGHNN